MAEMSMKTKAASQDVVVASRREAIGRRGEVEADARGTRRTWTESRSNIIKYFEYFHNSKMSNIVTFFL